MRHDRRSFALGLASTLLAPASFAGVTAHSSPESSRAPAGSSFSTHEFSFGKRGGLVERARAYVPHGLTPEREWPVAILLHGYAQALSEDRAVSAWRDEYDVLGAYAELCSAHVAATPALGAPRAREIERELLAQPFGGMVLVTPVTPIPYFQRDLGAALQRYTDWLHGQLLPKVAQVAPISSAPEDIGLAGVSMGGLVGLELMWRFPERFGAYCGIQIAIKHSQAANYAWLLQRAFDGIDDGRGRPIRVITATRDTYLRSNQAFYRALLRNKLEASLELRHGAHTSRWMRQAGSLESLLWLDRTLNRGLAPAASAASGQSQVEMQLR